MHPGLETAKFPLFPDPPSSKVFNVHLKEFVWHSWPAGFEIDIKYIYWGYILRIYHLDWRSHRNYFFLGCVWLRWGLRCAVLAAAAQFPPEYRMIKLAEKYAYFFLKNILCKAKFSTKVQNMYSQKPWKNIRMSLSG